MNFEKLPVTTTEESLFYERLGATVLDDWRICRLDEPRIAHVASRWHNQDG